MRTALSSSCCSVSFAVNKRHNDYALNGSTFNSLPPSNHHRFETTQNHGGATDVTRLRTSHHFKHIFLEKSHPNRHGFGVPSQLQFIRFLKSGISLGALKKA